MKFNGGSSIAWQRLRAARPRTFHQVVELVAIALPLFSPPECLNFVRHAAIEIQGYEKRPKPPSD